MSDAHRGPQTLLFHNVVAPYRHGLFRELAKRIPLEVGYATLKTRDRDWSTEIPGDYRSQVLPSWTAYAFGRPLTVCVGVRSWIKSRKPDAVISVLTRSNLPDVLRLGWMCRAKRIDFLLWVGDVDKSLVVPEVPSILMRAFEAGFSKALSMASGVISYSELTDRWLDLRACGKPRITGTQVLDPPPRRPRIRQLPAKGPIRMLFVGKHEPRKGLMELVAALHHLPHSQLANLQLVTVGSGPLVTRLLRVLPRQVKLLLLGNQPSADLWSIYADADLTVLPSLEDPWGFVTNESMSMGTPVAASSRCGSAELALRAGWVFDIADAQKTASTLNRAIVECRSDELRRRAVESEAQLRPETAAIRIVSFLTNRPWAREEHS